VQGLLEFLKTLGAPRIAAMGAVTIARVGFFAFLILRVTAPQMTPLFTDLAFEDSAAVVKELEAVFDVPVQVSAVLGRARMEIGNLLKLGPGTVLELDRKVGEAIDIYVNNRLVARGEVVLVEEKLGVTMTEIIKAERA
jgi:flagellar motor switch protein FliN/FliY